MRRLLHRVFFVPLPLVPLVDLPCFLLLAQCLRAGETGIVAHIAYLLSTWALSVTIVAGVRVWQRLRRMPAFVMISAVLAAFLKTDPALTTRLALYGSATFNAFYATVKLVTGIRYRSVWFCSLGGYYFILGILRLVILRSDRRSPIGRDRVTDLRRCRLCGQILLGMDLMLIAVVVQAARSEGTFYYPGLLIYIMALYAFGVNINAAVKLVRYYRIHSPLLTAAKVVTETAAMVSMLSLEVALIDRFGGDVAFRQQMTALLGGIICALEAAMALSMILRCDRALRTGTSRRPPSPARSGRRPRAPRR